MSKSPPETEVPLTLRASKALSMGRDTEGQAPGAVAGAPLVSGSAAVADAPAQARADGDEWITTPALAACGVALLLGTGWLLQRRRLLAARTQPHADAGSDADHIAATAEPVQRPEQPVGPPVDAMAAVAAQLREPAALQPQQSFPAPLDRRRRHLKLLGVAREKRLIKGLMWLRAAAGAAAILAAIAMVVSWAIEATDLRAGETGLTKPLLVLLLAGWAMWWGAGQLANHLHRAFFGRVHPKFDN